MGKASRENHFYNTLRMAEEGQAAAQFDVGMMYFEGSGIKKDEIEAFKWWQTATEKGNSWARAALDIPRGRDLKEEVKRLQPLTEQGDLEAQYLLGILYYFGLGIEKNAKEAQRLWRSSAEAGHAKAQIAPGQEHITKHRNEFHRLRPLAEQGDAGAQLGLGYMYEHAEWVAQDWERAEEWYAKAAIQGLARAQLFLGLCRNRKEDYKGAMEWFRKASDQGVIPAQHWIGLLFARGAGVKQDYAEAYKWFCKAAETGFSPAQRALSDMYENGTGVPQDYTRAYMWRLVMGAGLSPPKENPWKELTSKMSSEQIAEAKRLAIQWLRAYPSHFIDKKFIDSTIKELEA